MTTVLVLGSGAREHAIVRSLAGDARVLDLHAAPGNPGIATLASCHTIDINKPTQVVDLATTLKCDLVVVGPEVPLTFGVAGALRKAGVTCFGPDAAAAQIEASKAFAKDVMNAAQVPTAAAHVCITMDEVRAALDAVARPGIPFVVKDDSLAAGKGVVVTTSRDEAIEHAQSVLAVGDAHATVLIEEYLDGPEVSLFYLSDGTNVRALLPATDFKRLSDNDEGPNTGGMGAYSPLPWAPEDLVEVVTETVAQPTVDEMRRRGTPFVGLLYAGLALTSRGIKVVEFNARFGDPETQAVLAMLDTPLLDLLTAAATGQLADLPQIRWKQGAAVCVVLACDGYPQNPRKGDEIRIKAAENSGDTAWLLHAGTANVDGRLVTAGGRVMSVVACGEDLAQARKRAYELAATVTFAGICLRSDIALAATLS